MNKFIGYTFNDINAEGAVVSGLSSTGVEVLIREERMSWNTIIMDFTDLGYWEVAKAKKLIRYIKETGRI